MSQRSIQDVIRQQEAQREARRQAEVGERIKRELILSEQRERARQEYLRRNQLLERVGFAPTTPSPGAGGGSAITQIGFTYWALLFSPDSVSGQNYTPQSMGRDSNGNIYVGSIDSSNAQKSIIRKLSTSGNIIWEKTLFNSNINSDMELSRILVLPNSQGVVCLYKSGLRKLDTNGNISWTFIHNISTDTLNLTSCVLNLAGDAIYVFGTKDNDTSFELAQFDLSTGAVSNNKLLIVDGSFFCKAYADIGLDSSGNILIPLANSTVPPFYNTTVIKIEPLISTGGASIIGT